MRETPYNPFSCPTNCQLVRISMENFPLSLRINNSTLGIHRKLFLISYMHRYDINYLTCKTLDETTDEMKDQIIEMI